MQGSKRTHVEMSSIARSFIDAEAEVLDDDEGQEEGMERDSGEDETDIETDEDVSGE